MNSLVKDIEISRITVKGAEAKPELLAVEEPLEIRIGFGSAPNRNQKSISVTMRTPGHDFELALGLLFTEGIIESINQIESIKYCEDVGKQEERGNVLRIELTESVSIDFTKIQRNFYTSSSCGVCGKSSIEAVLTQCRNISTEWQILSSLILTLPEKLRAAQQAFTYTGGLHASGLFTTAGELVLIREDVGRHNALDKVIGAMFYKKALPLADYILLVSGRTSFELVQKAAVAGVPVVAAVGAPSSLAVSLAQQCGITLLGFIRDERFNMYSGNQRIALH